MSGYDNTSSRRTKGLKIFFIVFLFLFIVSVYISRLEEETNLRERNLRERYHQLFRKEVLNYKSNLSSDLPDFKKPNIAEEAKINPVNEETTSYTSGLTSNNPRNATNTNFMSSNEPRDDINTNNSQEMPNQSTNDRFRNPTEDFYFNNRMRYQTSFVNSADYEYTTYEDPIIDEYIIPKTTFETTFEDNKIVVDGVLQNRKGEKYHYKPLVIEFPKLEISDEAVKEIEEYLQPSYSEKNKQSKNGFGENAIKKHIKNIEIPENIRLEVINLDFKFKLEAKKKKGHFINPNTWNEIKENTKDSFLKRIIDLIQPITFDKIPNKCDEKEMSNYLSINSNEKEFYSEEMLNENSLFLNLQDVVLHESEIKSYLETKRTLNIFEKKICCNFKFVYCEERIIQITKYFESYGLIVPEELVDYLTDRFIVDPVLFDPNDDNFTDIETRDSILKSGSSLNPYNRSEILLYDDLNPEQKIIYDEKIEKQKLKNEVFLNKLGEKFKNFYVKKSRQFTTEYQLN